MEQRWAKEYGCNLIGVKEEDARHGVADFATEIESAPADLKHIFNDVEFIPLRRRGYECTVNTSIAWQFASQSQSQYAMQFDCESLLCYAV